MKVQKTYQAPQIDTIRVNCIMLNALSSIKVNEDTVIDDEEEVKSRSSHPNVWDDGTEDEDD